MTSSSVAYFNDETSHKPENLHCWFWSDSNPSALLVWKFVFIILCSYSFHNRAKILSMPSAWDLRNAAKSETCSKWHSKVSDFLEQAASVLLIITGGCNKNPGLSIFPYFLFYICTRWHAITLPRVYKTNIYNNIIIINQR